MKKIGIITTHHYPNYGNKLQNYALQTILRRMGFDVETINDARSWKNMNSWIANWKVLLHCLTRFRLTSYHIKMFKFIRWSKRNIKYSNHIINKDEDADNLAESYDYFVVGADQIWNPEWPMFSNAFGFAAFADKKQKVAYAPSFGVSEMPAERVVEYKSWLKKWKALSCREYDGAKIIKDLTGQDVPVVIDPTLLLTAADWEKIISKKVFVDERYALLYTLRDVDDVAMDSIVQKVKEKGLKLLSIHSPVQNDVFGPDDFIRLFKEAEMVFTDSFHGCAFALQFHRPLCVLHLREKSSGKDKISRIQTLFEQAGIQHENFSNTLNNFFDLDWNDIDVHLDEKRNESIQYLKCNLM